MRFDGMILSTEEIRMGVLREFGHDPSLADADIEVTVRDGTVTLTGRVAGGARHLAALEAARRSEGVFDVIDHLAVEGDKRPADQEIADAVRSAFAWDTTVPDRSIRVAVSNGWVALSGTVERLRELEEAEHIASRLNGVRGVYNLIEVSPRAATAAVNARDAIQQALRRFAEQEADAITVNFKGGTADVSGKVRTWAEKQIVLGALGDAPGVENVKDRLTITPF
jgi:osmotically-inducible protein OsmY